MRWTSLFAASVVAGAALTTSFQGRSAESESAVARLRRHAEYLASDELEGRGPKTKGIDRAAEYIAAQFASAGLRTNAYQGRAFQEFYLSRGYALGKPNHAEMVGPKGQRLALELGQSFTPLALGTAGKLDFPLAFVGYGISAPELGYDDYAKIDVQGRAVIVLRHEPQQGDEQSVFDGQRNSPHAFLSRKLAVAEQHGAKAVIFCNDGYNLGVRDNAPDNAQFTADKLLEFNTGGGAPRSSLPALHLQRDILDKLLHAAGAPSLLEFEKRADERLETNSRDLTGWRIQGVTTTVRTGKALKNVIGVLPGENGLQSEAILIGAHYDHLGLGGDGSLAPWTVDIHNGADDNASGTTVLLEVARRLAAQQPRLKRTVVFVAFSAEEMGLIGSERYVRAPLIPLDRTVAMLNLDMVGRLRQNRVTVYGVGTASEFQSLVTQHAGRQELAVRLSPSGYGPSDHATFHARGVPVLHFFTGLHADYHRPSDDADKLDYAGMDRIASMVTEIARELANRESRPSPKPTDWVADLDYGDDLETTDATPSPQERQEERPRLGVMLRSAAVRQGILVDSVIDGGPAHRAGLRAGDVILRADDQTMDATARLHQQLKTKKPGDSLMLEVQRGDLQLQLKVIFGSR